MNCQCEVRLIDGMRICIKCGLTEHNLDPSIFSYNHAPPSEKRSYTRKIRFMRLLQNLQGHQFVSSAIMKCIPENIKSPGHLIKYLKKTPDLRRHQNKAPSIWYQLGHRWNPLSQRDFARAEFEFNKVFEKILYLVLLPYICRKIGRPDLVKFCKPVSENMARKYNHLLPQD